MSASSTRWQRQPKDVLEAEALQALADEGYYSSLELKACEDDGITAYVPVPEGNGHLEKKGRFSLKDFSYDRRGQCLPLSGR